MTYEAPARDVFDRAFARWRTEVTCRSTIGEYPVYDEHLYRWLIEDKARIGAYRDAIQRAVSGKRVVDIGTGATAPLAIYCAEAGALHVDAIEVIPSSAEAARDWIAKLGLTDKITVHCGPSASIVLDEPSDLCVSEVIGMIGGAEGAASTLRSARRLMKPSGRMIPKKCLTWFAPAIAVSRPYTDPDCRAVASYYENLIHGAVGFKLPFSRTVTFNFPEENLLAGKEIFEDLHFEADPIDRSPGRAEFLVDREGILGGFVLWIELHIDDLAVIDSWRGSSWAPVFLSTSSHRVKLGDTIQVHVTSSSTYEGENPSYRIFGEIKRGQEHIASLALSSPYA